MSQFIESIRIKNRKASNLEWHKRRVQNCFENFFHGSKVLDLEEIIENNPIEENGVFKFRIIYDNVSHQISVSPYIKKEINSLMCIHNDNINYSFKHNDRSELKSMFDKRGNADDILIIKNGLVTDSHYANVAFLKKDHWHTPKEPLLKGTQRAKLVAEKRIKLLEIKSNEINNFEKVALFNAMIPFEERIEISTEAIMNC